MNKNEKQKIDKSIIITGMIIFGVLIAIFGILGFFKNVAGHNMVSATGESSIEVLPDFVSIYFAIQTKGDTAEDANTENSKIFDTLKDSLIAIGFNESEIKTQGFSVYPNYEWDGRTQTENGYVANHNVLVRIDLNYSDLIGRSIDAGINSGAGINYINYELTKENQNKYKAEAIKLATQDATIKADALAEGAGKRLGRLVSVSTSEFYYSSWRSFSGEDSIESLPATNEIMTQISPNEQEITARVSASFRIR